ncbi:signal peptide peptidase SppA [Candidatus Woesearchaeota archaeon]|nr:signal peptide peptidase SppA [Candidatus Woesearchaeota archaeon]
MIDVMKNTSWIIIIVVIVLVVLSFIIAMFYAAFSGETGEIKVGGKTADVALIKLSGAIMGEKQPGLFATGGSVSPVIVDYLKKAKENTRMKAILLEINSPGGTVVASKEIAAAVEDAKTKKPVVAWIREVGASGGYWVASSTDFIVADEMSITGSIGVLGSYVSFSGLMEDYNVTYERLVGGQYKDAGSPFKELTEEERKLLQDRIDIIHEAFIQKVAKDRNIPYENAKAMATGMFYLGKQAKEMGLIDQLGSKKEVEQYLKNKLQVEKVSFVEYKRKPTFLDALTQVMSQSFFFLGKGVSDGMKEINVQNDYQLYV